MKQSLIWILLLVAALGIAFWFLSQETAEAPTTGELNETDEAPVDGRSDTGASADYIGLTEAEAAAQAAENDVPFRVVERDGELLPTTRDFRPGRINAEVSGGVVTSYMVEGQGSTDETPGMSTSSDQGDDPNEDEGGDDEAAGEHDAIIGMTEAEAAAYAEANDVPFRVGFIDGEALPVTMDYRPGRITVALEDGVVTSYSVE